MSLTDAVTDGRLVLSWTRHETVRGKAIPLSMSFVDSVNILTIDKSPGHNVNCLANCQLATSWICILGCISVSNIVLGTTSKGPSVVFYQRLLCRTALFYHRLSSVLMRPSAI